MVAEGHDLHSLLFSLLDEFLFLFCTEGVVCCEVKLVGEVDRVNWRCEVEARGEVFDLARHPQGTEVKAITYSAMQVHGVRGVGAIAGEGEGGGKKQDEKSGSGDGAAGGAGSDGNFDCGGKLPYKVINPGSNTGELARRKGKVDIFVVLDI